MRFGYLGIVAAAALLAACSSTPEEVVELKGAGAPPSPAAPPPTTSQLAVRPPAGATAPGSAQDFQVNVGDRVLFGYDKSDIAAQSRTVLEKQAVWLKTYPSVRVTIEGHADERGTREYNLALGERRAVAVKNFLVALGIPAARLQTISYGKERPAVAGSNEQAWAQNRRGVTVIN